LIRAVTFDFGGTLATGKLDAETYREGLLHYLHSLGYGISGASLGEAISGMLSKLERVQARNLELKFEEVYAGVLSNLGIPPREEFLDYIYQLYSQNFHSEILPGAERVLKILHLKYKLAVISNATSNLCRRILKENELDKFFQVIVISRDLGIRKPDPRIFHYTLEKLQVKPDEAVHVGDSIEQDIMGAKRAGLKAVWIKDKEEEETLEELDCIIRTITELPRIIETKFK